MTVMQLEKYLLSEIENLHTRIDKVLLEISELHEEFIAQISDVHHRIDRLEDALPMLITNAVQAAFLKFNVGSS